MIERIDIADWLRFDAAHPAPTFFARPAWALAIAEVYRGMQPALLRIRARGCEPVLVPLMESRDPSFPLRHFTAFPLGGYTCFLHEDGTLAQGQALNAALHELSRFAHSAVLIPWPLGPAPAHAGAREHLTAVVDLSDGIENALTRVDGCFRRMAGQAARRGVTCAPAYGAEAVDTYYALLRESAKRWGIPEPVERRKLIEALVRHGGDDVEIWFARAEGQAIAGGVVFYGGQEFFFWSAAMLGEFGRLRPSNALNFALLHAAAQRGMQWYNLGSSEGLPGVARFKKDLGARDVPYREIDLARLSVRVARTVRNALNRGFMGYRYAQ
jgi:CelD/BcsL family acetyltransferase involved in cellulose biosynthesis